MSDSTAAPRELLPQHRQLIEDSGISEDVAVARGYFSVSEPKDLVGMFGPSQRLAPGLVIPVFNVYGETVYFQLRPDEPRVKDGRRLKYETPARAPMVIDVPPSTRPHLRNPKVTLWVTEGIRKADALASVGLRSVALLGVWNWRGRGDDGGSAALADWEAIALNDKRKVVICFDSDAFENPGVHAATERLGRMLEHRGAEVAFVYLPAAEDGSKVGVDDYLAAGASKEDLLGLVVREWRPLPSQRRTGAPAREPAEPRTLAEVLAAFHKWMYLPDEGAVLAAVGAVAANMLDGDPVWLLIVGPPSGGKSEIVQSTAEIPGVHKAATLTEGALLSGTAARDRASDAQGGLLNEIGSFGVLMMKDFGSVLNQHNDKRAPVLAAMRECFDGSWTRHVGVDGGRTLHWEGKLGLLAGVTPIRGASARGGQAAAPAEPAAPVTGAGFDQGSTGEPAPKRAPTFGLRPLETVTAITPRYGARCPWSPGGGTCGAARGGAGDPGCQLSNLGRPSTRQRATGTSRRRTRPVSVELRAAIGCRSPSVSAAPQRPDGRNRAGGRPDRDPDRTADRRRVRRLPRLLLLAGCAADPRAVRAVLRKSV